MASPAKRSKCRYDFVAFHMTTYFFQILLLSSTFSIFPFSSFFHSSRKETYFFRKFPNPGMQLVLLHIYTHAFSSGLPGVESGGHSYCCDFRKSLLKAATIVLIFSIYGNFRRTYNDAMNEHLLKYVYFGKQPSSYTNETPLCLC